MFRRTTNTHTRTGSLPCQFSSPTATDPFLASRACQSLISPLFRNSLLPLCVLCCLSVTLENSAKDGVLLRRGEWWSRGHLGTFLKWWFLNYPNSDRLPIIPRLYILENIIHWNSSNYNNNIGLLHLQTAEGMPKLNSSPTSAEIVPLICNRLEITQTNNSLLILRLHSDRAFLIRILVLLLLLRVSG